MSTAFTSLSCWQNTFSTHPTLRRTRTSAVVNPSNKKQILFTIKSICPGNLYILNILNETIETHPLILTDSAAATQATQHNYRLSDSQLIVNQIPNSNTNKVIAYGILRATGGYTGQYTFFGVINTTTLQFNRIIKNTTTNDTNNNNNNNIPITNHGLIGFVEDQLHVDTKFLYIYDWLFASHGNALYIFKLNPKTNDLILLTVIDIPLYYLNGHGMILMPKKHENDEYNIKILLFGGKECAFFKSFTCIRMSIESLNDLERDYYLQNGNTSGTNGTSGNEGDYIEPDRFDYVMDSQQYGEFEEVVIDNLEYFDIFVKKYFNFSFNVVENRYLLLTGGLDSEKIYEPLDIAIFYDFFQQKWYNCTQPLSKSISCHATILKEYGHGEHYLYCLGNSVDKGDCIKFNLDEIMGKRLKWNYERLLWIAYKKEENKNTIFHRICKDILDLIINFL